MASKQACNLATLAYELEVAKNGFNMSSIKTIRSMAKLLSGFQVRRLKETLISEEINNYDHTSFLHSKNCPACVKLSIDKV